MGEASTDSPQHALIGEVTTILDNLQLLNDSLRQAEKVRGWEERTAAVQVHKELVVGKAKLEYRWGRYFRLAIPHAPPSPPHPPPACT